MLLKNVIKSVWMVLVFASISSSVVAEKKTDDSSTAPWLGAKKEKRVSVDEDKIKSLLEKKREKKRDRESIEPPDAPLPRPPRNVVSGGVVSSELALQEFDTLQHPLLALAPTPPVMNHAQHHAPRPADQLGVRLDARTVLRLAEHFRSLTDDQSSVG